MEHAASWSATDYFNTAYSVMQPFIWPLLLWLISLAVQEMKRRGYQTTYATAIARALGAGVDAATAKGLDPFRGEGRTVAIQNGIGYLRANVNTAAVALGILTDVQHADRIAAEMGSVMGKSIADAAALNGSLTKNVTAGQLNLLGDH